MNDKRVLWITKTAIFIAVLVVAQYVTKPLNMQVLTGSVVNLVLILSVTLGGFASGAAVAVISPVFAFLLGIPAFPVLVPFIMAGNLTLVGVWAAFDRLRDINEHVRRVAALAVGAAAKFAVLYAGVVRVALPYIMTDLKPKQVETLSAMFSFTQLLTAAIGGALAMVCLPFLTRALRRGYAK